MSPIIFQKHLLYGCGGAYLSSTIQGAEADRSKASLVYRSLSGKSGLHSEPLSPTNTVLRHEKVFCFCFLQTY
ncbi:hypothetical protein ACQP3L_34255, partial [Escherichia coli]